MKSKIKVAVLGSSGYVGLELIKILTRHPDVDINFLGTEQFENKNISDLDHSIDRINLPNLSLNKDFVPNLSDLVFLCLPHGVTHNFVKKLYNKIKIIDLSADFRLDSNKIYSSNYGNNHSCPELLSDFIYGLPEINRKKIKQFSNISIPGCYPTSILLPLIPLVKDNLINLKNIIIDSKSGYSGAGKKFDLSNIKKINEYNFYNYNTNTHRHICEIKQELDKCTKRELNFSFNPHILPSFRGMMSTIYCDLETNITSFEIKENLIKFYKDSFFVKFINDDSVFDFFSIQNTNNCMIRIFKHHSDSKVIIVSLIDNLLKGAAGQAVQCFNILFDFDENLSLVN